MGWRLSTFAVLWGLFAVAAVGCKKGGGPGGKPVVVASIFPVYDLTRRVAGDAVHVELMLAPGREVHDYNPTTKDAKRVAGARLAFIVGLELDEWTKKIIDASGAAAPIVELGERVETKRFQLDRVGAGEAHEEHDEHEGEGEGGDHGGHHHRVDAGDPHVWLSVPLAVEMVGVIESELAGTWPDKAEIFAANARALRAELDALDAEIRQATAVFSRKAFVTFHGSFGYFAAEYKLEIAAVIEPYPGKEPSPAYLREVLTAISKKPISALYTEPQLDPRPAQVLAREAKLELLVLDPVGGLEGRESYAAMMRFNLEALAASLK
jgi:ABC-type Zn uptake system ZnuABC Zn-binding protein ZnuA